MSDYLRRIMGNQIDLSPEMIDLAENSYLLHLNNFATRNRFVKLNNLINENNNYYESVETTIEKRNLVIVINNDKKYDVGSIYLDMELHHKILSMFIGYEPVLYLYDDDTNSEVVKEDLIDTIRIKEEEDIYGFTR